MRQIKNLGRQELCNNSSFHLNHTDLDGFFYFINIKLDRSLHHCQDCPLEVAGKLRLQVLDQILVFFKQKNTTCFPCKVIFSEFFKG